MTTPSARYSSNMLMLITSLLMLSASKAYASNHLTIDIDESQTFQRHYGVGASWTDSSAWLMNGYRGDPDNTRYLTETERQEILNAFFNKQGEGNIGLDLLRQPMGTSDYRWYDYTFEDVRGSFTIERDMSYIIPTILQSLEINPTLKVMALPWSAPAWIKQNLSLLGGNFDSSDPAKLQDYIDYFVKFVNHYEAEGVPIWALSVQNEPLHEVDSYPTMKMTSSEMADMIIGVRSALDSIGKEDIRIVGFDHNWDLADYARGIMDHNAGAARQATSAIAFHCYGGDKSAQTSFHDQYPDVEVFFTECTEHGNIGSYNGDFRWALRELVIGGTRNWASTLTYWNLVLNEQHGPKADGGCSNCRGLITINDDGTYSKNPAFYALGHLSKFLIPGALRVSSSEPNGDTKTLAMLNPDGSSFLIILNNGDSGQSFTYNIQSWAGADCSSLTITAWSAVTLFRPSGSVVAQVWRTVDQDSSKLLSYTEDLTCISNGAGATTTESTTELTTSTTTSSSTPLPQSSTTSKQVASSTTVSQSTTSQGTTSTETIPDTTTTLATTSSGSSTVAATETTTSSPQTSGGTPPCCTSDYAQCHQGSCSDSESNCASCGGHWGVVDGTCQAFNAVCTNIPNPNCCGGATCQGNQYHKACVPSPDNNPTPSPPSTTSTSTSTLPQTTPETSSTTEATSSSTTTSTTELLESATPSTSPSTLYPTRAPSYKPSYATVSSTTTTESTTNTAEETPPCCTPDFAQCHQGWCSDSETNCASCGGHWGVVDGSCLAFYAVCTNIPNPNCCGGATCEGNQYHKACIPP